MNSNDTLRPVCTMCDSARTLRDQAQSVHHQASQGVEQARTASEALAKLDLDKAFQQLRQMVSMLTERPDENRHADNIVSFPAQRQTFAQAAE